MNNKLRRIFLLFLLFWKVFEMRINYCEGHGIDSDWCKDLGKLTFLQGRKIVKIQFSLAALKKLMNFWCAVLIQIFFSRGIWHFFIVIFTEILVFWVFKDFKDCYFSKKIFTFTFLTFNRILEMKNHQK